MSLVDNATSLRVVFNSGASDCTAAAAEQVTFGWRELPADPEGCREAAKLGGGSVASSGKFAASQAGTAPRRRAALLFSLLPTTTKPKNPTQPKHRTNQPKPKHHQKTNPNPTPPKRGISRFPPPASVFMQNKGVGGGSPKV